MTKTPVSILQEMCIRRGNPPHYELIHDGGGTHEALFKYQVLVEDVRAIGSGRSKKEAKHDAARNMLERLKEDRASTPVPMVQEIIEVGDVMSPYKDQLTENAVGALQELCMTNEIQLPIYELIGDEGPPHSKQFTIKCQVSKLEEIAVARTKKQAKQLAAHRMLNVLKTSLADVLPTTTNENVETPEKNSREQNTDIAVTKYKELGTLGSSRGRTVIGQKISEYHLMLRSLKGELLEKLKEDDCVVQQQLSNDPVDLLNQLLVELNIDYEFESVQSTKEDKSVVLLSMSTSPEAVIFGMAISQDEAHKNAAKTAVEYLKLMNI